MVAIGESLSDLASSDDGEDGEGEVDEETEQGQLSGNEEPGWAIGTITKTVQQRLDRSSQKLMKLNELTRPGWEEQAITFVTEIRSKAHPHCVFRHSLKTKPMMMERHRYGQTWETIWSVLTSSPEYLKCRKRLLNQEVVILRQVR